MQKRSPIRCGFELFTFGLLFLCAGQLQCAFEKQPLSAWNVAVGQIPGIGYGPGDFTTNPALFSLPVKITATASFFHPFGIPDLNVAGIGMGFQLHRRFYYVWGQKFSANPYQEQILSSGIAGYLFPPFKLGLILTSHQLDLQGYQSQRHLTLSLGYAIQTGKSGLLAGTWYNVAASKGPTVTRPPPAYGLGYLRTWSHISLLAGLGREGALPLNLALGVMITIHPYLKLGVGYSSLAKTFSLGLRVSWRHWHLSLGWLHHPRLPGTIYHSLAVGS